MEKKRRMIRNRVSAQVSREKKKEQLEYYENLSMSLQKSNNELKQRFDYINSENLNLKNEIHFLRNKFNYHEPFSNINTTTTTNNNNQNLIKKSVFVMVFLFAVGLFINFSGGFSTLSKTKTLPLELAQASVGRILLNTNSTLKTTEK